LETKLLKTTRCTVLVNGILWPIVHELEGNPSRGYTVTTDCCRGDGSDARRRSFRSLWAAKQFFASLPGEEYAPPTVANTR
jgi:hypothetical protein